MYLYFMVHILGRIAMHKALTTCVFLAPAPPVMRKFLDPSFPVTILEQFDRMQILHTIRLKVFTVRVKKSLPKDVKLLTMAEKSSYRTQRNYNAVFESVPRKRNCMQFGPKSTCCAKRKMNAG